MARELNLKKIGDVVDVSAVKADADLHEVNEMIRIVRQYNCVCAAPMPWSTERTLEGLKGTPAVVTGVVGFPSGATFPEAKAAEATKKRQTKTRDRYGHEHRRVQVRPVRLCAEGH